MEKWQLSPEIIARIQATSSKQYLVYMDAFFLCTSFQVMTITASLLVLPPLGQKDRVFLSNVSIAALHIFFF